MNKLNKKDVEYIVDVYEKMVEGELDFIKLKTAYIMITGEEVMDNIISIRKWKKAIYNYVNYQLAIEKVEAIKYILTEVTEEEFENDLLQIEETPKKVNKKNK